MPSKKLPPIKILYESPDCLVINKPAGLVVHRDGKTVEPTVSDWVVKQYPEAENVGEAIELSEGGVIPRHGIVHRLDKETSGCLLIAKNQRAFKLLKRQFQNREVKKVYHAFVYGPLKYEDGIIDKPIARSATDFRRHTTSHMTRGESREAVTAYRVLARGEEATFIEARPQTGRTHQIRVHMKSLEHPVVADSLYASYAKPVLGFDRLALHARALSFTDPSGETASVEAPYPKDFQVALREIGREDLLK